MIPLGIDLNTIPREQPESKAIIPIEEPILLAVIPPQPRCYGQSYFAQPIRTRPLLLEGAPLKGPIITLPARTNLLPPRHNEKLFGGKTNKKGEFVYAMYTTSERTYFEGSRSSVEGQVHPPKGSFDIRHGQS